MAVRMARLRCRFHHLSCLKAVDPMVVDSMDCRMVADLTGGNWLDWRDSMVTTDLKVIHWNLTEFAGTGSQATS